MAPLSSTSLISNQLVNKTLASVQRELSGEAAAERQRQRLEDDLLRLKLDIGRAGFERAVKSNPGVQSFGSVRSAKTASAPSPLAAGFPSLTSVVEGVTDGRDTKIKDVNNIAGLTRIQSGMTGNMPVYLPGEGDMSGIDELATAMAIGLPQVIYQSGKTVVKQLPSAVSEQSKIREALRLGIDMSDSRWKDRLEASLLREAEKHADAQRGQFSRGRAGNPFRYYATQRNW